MELLILLIFAAALMTCVILSVPTFIPLLFGYVLFSGYALSKGFSAKDVLGQSLKGFKTVKGILITFVFIGMMTAAWRACGSIPYIVYYSVKVCSPSIIITASFLICGLISTLTGTSFGTAATVGVICMTMSVGMGVSPMWMGGAILSGCFLGDRCSPMSTSALLVCELTSTDIYDNIKGMVRTAIVPFLASCAIYTAAGFLSGGGVPDDSVQNLLLNNFSFSPLLLLPVAAIIVLAVLKVKVRIAMLVSTVLAFFAGIFVQGIPAASMLKFMITGFEAANPEIASMINGGGVLSMKSVFIIVGISSFYAGIFEETGFLSKIQAHILQLAISCRTFGAICIVSLLSAMVSCNQSLASILTYQLCKDLKGPKKLALDLENSVIVIAALIPWSIACAVPISTVGAPKLSIVTACYLWLIPLWNWLRSKPYKEEKHD